MDPGRTRKGRKRNFCLEIHQQGFMSVTERNTEHVNQVVVKILVARDDVEVDTRYEAGHTLLSYAAH